MPKINDNPGYIVPEPSEIEGVRPYSGDDPEYRATVRLHHATKPTREHLEALAAAALDELVDATEWHATFNPYGGSVNLVALFRAPNRRTARDRQRAALQAAQKVNGKVSRHDRCGKPEFVRNYRPQTG